MPEARKALSKKLRFEVFKRDSFTCQYCGEAAPKVLLRVDHIHPVASGGDNELINLITACFDCNAGKGARELSDDSALTRQRNQLDELNARREQLEMMLQWRQGMRDLDDQALDAMHEAWQELTAGWYWNERGLNTARKHLKKHGLQKCLDAIEIARQYIDLRQEKEGEPFKATQESVELASKKIGGILAMMDKPEDEKRLYYIKGILRNRLAYVNHHEAMRLMRAIIDEGGNPDWIEQCAKECRHWTQWQDWILYGLAELRGEHWWQSEEKTLAEGKRLGLEPKPGEEMETYRARVRAARGES